MFYFELYDLYENIKPIFTNKVNCDKFW